jgi:hypothetical protein
MDHSEPTANLLKTAKFREFFRMRVEFIEELVGEDRASRAGVTIQLASR